MTENVEVIQPEDHEDMPLEILAEHIAALSEIGKALDNSRLKRRTILLLLRDLTNVGMRDIEYVLNALPLLESKYLKPKRKP